MIEALALQRVLAGERAEDVVPETLRAHRELDGAGRARVARRVYGASVLRARLTFLSGASDAQELVDAYVRFEENGESTAHVVWPTDPLERMCVERSAPMFMVRDLVDALGVIDADSFLVMSNIPAPATLRANTLKCTRDALAARLRSEGVPTQEHMLAPHAVVVEGRANLFGTDAWRDGWFEVQDASSQHCVEKCIEAGVEPGATVVDLCAGRGGKTLALAAAMNDEGTLYVHDVDAKALADMQPRLKRAGVTCVRTLDGAPQADVVLVDAPCSSWGPLRRSPDLRWTQRREDLADFPVVQRALVSQARELVRPGGRIVYATCTVRRAENDDVVPRGRTLLPHRAGCDGFYVAFV
jgi:16S rRNA (cytosine967-C5)-methyltransferase